MESDPDSTPAPPSSVSLELGFPCSNEFCFQLYSMKVRQPWYHWNSVFYALMNSVSNYIPQKCSSHEGIGEVTIQFQTLSNSAV